MDIETLVSQGYILSLDVFRHPGMGSVDLYAMLIPPRLDTGSSYRVDLSVGPEVGLAEVSKASFQFTPKHAGQLQRLVNSLWEVGVRPEQAEGSDSRTGAITRHLDDMRAIVGKQLKIDSLGERK